MTGFDVEILAAWERGAGYQDRATDRYLRLLRTTNGMSLLREILDELKR